MTPLKKSPFVSRICPLAAVVLLPILPIHATLPASASGTNTTPAGDDSAKRSAEYNGLDVPKFKAWVKGEAEKTGGKLEVAPDTVKQQLLKFGMDKKVVTAMFPSDVTSLVSKIFAEEAKVDLTTGAASNPDGVDFRKLLKILTEEGAKTNGKIKVTPEVLKKWLRESGVSEERLKSMSVQDMTAILKQANLAAGGNGQTSPSNSAEQPAADYPGLDIAKFRKSVLDQAAKNGGKVSLDMDGIKKLMKDAGMQEAAINALPQHKLVDAVMMVATTSK
jgi:hypothetical protein